MSLNPCPLCGGEAIQHDHMLCVVCSQCGAATRDFTGSMGKFQREHCHAGYAWNRGEVQPAEESKERMA